MNVVHFHPLELARVIMVILSCRTCFLLIVGLLLVLVELEAGACRLIPVFKSLIVAVFAFVVNENWMIITAITSRADIIIRCCMSRGRPQLLSTSYSISIAISICILVIRVRLA